MIDHPSITIGKDGEVQINLDSLREFAESESQELDAVLARLIIVAYEFGVQAGIAEASKANLQAQVLMHCTGGNA
jgi:hypothetical protein